ncbi:MAG: hypothetical protein QF915_00220 [Candidatus Woesearchaeota archaeon]|jgi:hypothetical protein|nr:hypothetical protein [Candidatus Woesearchaeota archaeon]MDP7457628.1 hypothetical protein [Candidatus Woesearchaeota archaeon]
MSQKDFNRQLNTYLSSRRKTSLREQFKSAFQRDGKVKEAPQQSTPEEIKQPQEEVFTGDTIEVIEEDAQSFFSKIFGFLGFGNKSEEVDLSEHETEQAPEEEAHSDTFEQEEQDFEQEVKKSSVFDKIVSWIFGKKRKQEDLDEVEVESDENFKKQIDELEAEEERIEEQETALKKKKNMIVKDILDKFVDRIELKDDGTDDEELKELAKITIKVIKKLSKSELDAFKDSYEFTRFKEILTSHNLLKTKKEESKQQDPK